MTKLWDLLKARFAGWKDGDSIGCFPLLCRPKDDDHAISNAVERPEMDHSHSLCLADELQEQRNRS